VESTTFRLPLWALRAAMITGISLGSVALISVILYGAIVRAAARVPFLTREISRLNAENEQVRALAGRLVEMEARYAQVRTMLGADIRPAVAAGDDSLPVSHPVFASIPDRQPVQPGPSAPRRWPLDEHGVVTRG